MAVALFLSMGTLQAQTQPNCDLSKCSPEERAACAKKCMSASTASLLSMFLSVPVAQLTDEKPANCKPSNCKPTNCRKKAASSEAKLVSTTTKTAATYSNSLEKAIESAITPTPTKKKCVPSNCSKKSTTL
jgi:hypothetical protein